MKLGAQTLATRPPDGERLLAASGCTPERMRTLLASHCIAGTVAAALNACLVDPQPRAELARAIAAEGVDSVRRRVLALYQIQPTMKGPKKRGKAKA